LIGGIVAAGVAIGAIALINKATEPAPQVAPSTASFPTDPISVAKFSASIVSRFDRPDARFYTDNGSNSLDKLHLSADQSYSTRGENYAYTPRDAPSVPAASGKSYSRSTFSGASHKESNGAHWDVPAAWELDGSKFLWAADAAGNNNQETDSKEVASFLGAKYANSSDATQLDAAGMARLRTDFPDLFTATAGYDNDHPTNITANNTLGF